MQDDNQMEYRVFSIRIPVSDVKEFAFIRDYLQNKAHTAELPIKISKPQAFKWLLQLAQKEMEKELPEKREGELN
jgi:hypothetical protein